MKRIISLISLADTYIDRLMKGYDLTDAEILNLEAIESIQNERILKGFQFLGRKDKKKDIDRRITDIFKEILGRDEEDEQTEE